MKYELEHVRNLARNRIESGVVPEQSWDRYVKLMEAAEAVLHDLAVQAPASEEIRSASGHLRLVSAEPLKPAQYQRRVYSLRECARSLQ